MERLNGKNGNGKNGNGKNGNGKNGNGKNGNGKNGKTALPIADRKVVKQTRKVANGMLIRHVATVIRGQKCGSCGKFHDEGSLVTEKIVPHDPRFCKFIWNNPPAPNPPRSKNQARLMAGTRNGPRKSRKRNAKGQIRQPNDWPMKHAADRGYCAHCNGILYTFARKLGNRKCRAVPFIDGQDRAVLYSIWLLTKYVWEKYSIGIPRDVVHLILHHAFTVPVLEDQRLKRDQFHSPCGCKYHMHCYASYVAQGRSTCSKHKKAFP
jgi:hypothetical protein